MLKKAFKLIDINRLWTLFIVTFKQENRLIIFGFLSAALYGILFFYSKHPLLLNITGYIGLFAVAFALYGVVITYYIKKKYCPPISCVIFFAFIFHAIGIFATPLFEDDFFRYLWDGYTFFELGSPYRHAPSFYFSDAAISSLMQANLNQINYPDIKTIYSPLLQYSFWLSYWLFPADVFGLQLIYSACNMVVIFILAKMINARSLLLYAWNPLIIKEVAFTAHPDILGVVFLVAAFYFFAKYPKTSALCLGLSVCSKPFAWVIAVYFLLRFKRVQFDIFFLTIVLLYMPFLFNGSELSGLFAFGRDWEFNAAIYSVLTYAMSGIHAKMVGAILLLCIMVYCFNRFHKTSVLNIRADLLMGGLILLSPVINPWYLMWLLPFAAMHHHLWPWVMSFTLLLSYFSGINLGSEHLAAYQLPAWVKPAEYFPVLLTNDL
ncbi:MAG: hypothetical protein GXP14_05940 [Gammaproteobacteria bacterium]|nr:hypothetical protein [Gammaproteobacteria bacterium]